MLLVYFLFHDIRRDILKAWWNDMIGVFSDIILHLVREWKKFEC